jgi:toxin-antitoxin system PIN domain toxin
VILCDVNVLLYAFRRDTARHTEYRDWLSGQLAGPANVGVSDLVLSSVIRIATHPKIFREPSGTLEAFEFTDAIRSSRNAVIVAPGPRHWGIFRGLCKHAKAKGNLIADAYLAALAIEWGCEWMTTDGDYGRFPGLKWRQPLE